MANNLYQSRFYKIWANMKTRCNNYKYKEYYRYGGRGITYDDKWRMFQGFFEDMYESYLLSGGDEAQMTLDRIDNNAGYSMDNCRWATRKEQALNTKRIEECAKYTYKGNVFTISELANLLGIKRTTLGMRLQTYKWSIEQAVKRGRIST